jgi:hypothetical protein
MRVEYESLHEGTHHVDFVPRHNICDLGQRPSFVVDGQDHTCLWYTGRTGHFSTSQTTEAIGNAGNEIEFSPAWLHTCTESVKAHLRATNRVARIRWASCCQCGGPGGWVAVFLPLIYQWGRNRTVLYYVQTIL